MNFNLLIIVDYAYSNTVQKDNNPFTWKVGNLAVHFHRSLRVRCSM